MSEKSSWNKDENNRWVSLIIHKSANNSRNGPLNLNHTTDSLLRSQLNSFSNESAFPSCDCCRGNKNVRNKPISRTVCKHRNIARKNGMEKKDSEKRCRHGRESQMQTWRHLRTFYNGFCNSFRNKYWVNLLLLDWKWCEKAEGPLRKSKLDYGRLSNYLGNPKKTVCLRSKINKSRGQ